MGFCGAGDSLVQLAPSVESIDLVNNRDYILHRCMWGVVEGAQEMGDGKGVVAEHNLDDLNGVSYHKVAFSFSFSFAAAANPYRMLLSSMCVEGGQTPLWCSSSFTYCICIRLFSSPRAAT